MKIKSKFYGWKTATKEQAIDYAKWKYKTLWSGENKKEWLIKHINSLIQGVEFEEKDLKCWQ